MPKEYKTCRFYECKDEPGFYVSQCEGATWNGDAEYLDNKECWYCYKPIEVIPIPPLKIRSSTEIMRGKNNDK